MGKRTARIEYTWASQRVAEGTPGAFALVNLTGLKWWYGYRVTWALYGANGEFVCGSNQGAKDKRDARRQVQTAIDLLTDVSGGAPLSCREVGPGRAPKVAA